jgi:PAS domain S-box-containing protein
MRPASIAVDLDGVQVQNHGIFKPTGSGPISELAMPSFKPPELPRTKILVVDDKAGNLLSMRAILEPLEQEILEARSGDDALRQLLKHDVSVVLLDIQMPGLDGFEVARLIRGREKDRHTPIIFLTAFEDHRFSVQEAYALGAVDYLVKPIVPAILLAKVAFFVELYQKAELLRQLGFEEREKSRESEARKAAILETALDCIITIDHEGRVVEFNPAAESTFGYSQLESLGRRMAELIVPERLRSAYYKGLERYLRTGEGSLLGQRLESIAMRRDGAEFPVELSIVPHGSGAKPLFTAHLRDITQRKQAEEQLRAAITREQDRAEQLREADRRKDEFLAMLAHELRNPLAAVANSLSIARTPGIDGQVLHWSQEVMERQIVQLKRLIDDLLDVSRITRGKITLRKEILPLELLIERAVDAIRPQFVRKRQELHVSLTDRGPLWVDVDPARVEQILGNVLTNASKYTQEQGKVTLSVQSEDEHAVVRIKDNGMGISAEMLPCLFDLFAQADRSLDRSHGGLGIGLTLVKKLAEMHGGSVAAASEGEGHGAEFTLRLALAQPLVPAKPLDNGRAHRRHGGRSSSESKRILVVDDNQDAALTLAMVLKVDGYVVEIANTGKEALKLAQRLEPEIVLLDIGLPEMDGYEVARQLRQLPLPLDPLLVAITGYGQPEDRARSQEAGFDYHLIKPVNVAELLRLCAAANVDLPCTQPDLAVG